MALIVGINGNVTCTLFGGAKLNFWTMNIDTGLDTSVAGFGDAGQGDGEATLLTYSGSASGTLEDSSQAGATISVATFSPALAEATLTLTSTTGDTWTGTVTVSNVTINVPYQKGSHGTVSFDWHSRVGFTSE